MYRFFFLLFFFGGTFLSSWGAAEEVSRPPQTLKQKFLELEHSLSPLGKPKGSVKRAAAKMGDSLKEQMEAILKGEKIEGVGGVNALAQKILLKPSPELLESFSARWCMTAAQDMKRFSINDDVFSYDYVKAGEARKSLFLQYTRATKEVIDVTTYSFFYTLLHNLDLLKKAMRGPSLDPQTYEKIFAVKPQLEANYNSIKISIEEIYGKASEGLTEALAEVTAQNP